MFDISDQQLDNIVDGGGGESRHPSSMGSMPVAMGDDVPQPSPGPAPAPVPPPMLAPPSGDGALRRGAGKALLYASVAGVGGGLLGGPFAAAAGVVAVGAIRNLVRTKDTWNHPDPQERSEAGKSATMAIFGLGIATMLGYHAYRERESA